LSYTHAVLLCTLDVLAEYPGHKGWEQLLASFNQEDCELEPVIEKLHIKQVKAGQLIRLTYEPAKVVEIKKKGSIYLVVSSNEKKLLLNDEVEFRSFGLHYCNQKRLNRRARFIRRFMFLQLKTGHAQAIRPDTGQHQGAKPASWSH
jgi:hypothetical protein